MIRRLGRQVGEAAAVEADPVDVAIVRIPRLAAARREVDLPGGFIHRKEITDQPRASGDPVLESAGGAVIEIEVTPAVPLGPPDDLAPVPGHVDVRGVVPAAVQADRHRRPLLGYQAGLPGSHVDVDQFRHGLVIEKRQAEQVPAVGAPPGLTEAGDVPVLLGRQAKGADRAGGHFDREQPLGGRPLAEEGSPFEVDLGPEAAVAGNGLQQWVGRHMALIDSRDDHGPAVRRPEDAGRRSGRPVLLLGPMTGNRPDPFDRDAVPVVVAHAVRREGPLRTVLEIPEPQVAVLAEHARLPVRRHHQVRRGTRQRLTGDRLVREPAPGASGLHGGIDDRRPAPQAGHR